MNLPWKNNKAVFFSLCIQTCSHHCTIKIFPCFCHSFKRILSKLILTSIDWLTNLPIEINCISDYLCMTLMLTSRSRDPSVCLAGWSIDSQTANTTLYYWQMSKQIYFSSNRRHPTELPLGDDCSTWNKKTSAAESRHCKLIAPLCRYFFPKTPISQ